MIGVKDFMIWRNLRLLFALDGGDLFLDFCSFGAMQMQKTDAGGQTPSSRAKSHEFLGHKKAGHHGEKV